MVYIVLAAWGEIAGHIYACIAPGQELSLPRATPHSGPLMRRSPPKAWMLPRQGGTRDGKSPGNLPRAIYPLLPP